MVNALLRGREDRRSLFEFGDNSTKVDLTVEFTVQSLLIYMLLFGLFQASWMKKGSMRWWRDDKREKWTECTVELELGLEKGDGYFTIQYTSQKKLKVNSII